jgi:hypothetical protein
MTQFAPQHARARELFKSPGLREAARPLDINRPVDAVFKTSWWPSRPKSVQTWIARLSELSNLRPEGTPFHAVSRFEIRNQDVILWRDLPANVQVSRLTALPPKPSWWSN